MQKGVNKAIIVGNLGRDPAVKNGGAVLFSVATGESWVDKNSGEKVEKTEWHNCVAFGKLGEIIAKYVLKGSKVYIEGKMQSRKYTDKDGTEKTIHEVVVNELQMLDGKNTSSSPAEPTAKNAIPGALAGEFKGGFDDDIPF